MTDDIEKALWIIDIYIKDAIENDPHNDDQFSVAEIPVIDLRFIRDVIASVKP